MTAVRHSLIIEKAYSWTPINNTYSSLHDVGKKMSCVVADPKTRWHTSKSISQQLLHDKGSLQYAKSPITYGFQVFVFLLAKRSHNNPNLGLAKNLAPNSQTIIWTIHQDKKKRPSSDVLGTRPRGLVPMGKIVPKQCCLGHPATLQFNWVISPRTIFVYKDNQTPTILRGFWAAASCDRGTIDGMKENTGIPHHCFNTYGQLMTRQKEAKWNFLSVIGKKGKLRRALNHPSI